MENNKMKVLLVLLVLLGLSLRVFLVIVTIGIGLFVGMKIVSFISVDHQVVKFVVYFLSISVSIKIMNSLLKIVNVMKVARSKK